MSWRSVFIFGDSPINVTNVRNHFRETNFTYDKVNRLTEIYVEPFCGS